MNRQDEDASQRSPLQQKISALMHDARTPLTSIIGFSELLLEDESLTGQSREYLEIINGEGNSLVEMLDRYRTELNDLLQAER